MKFMKMLVAALALVPSFALAQTQPMPGANYTELKPAQAVETPGKVEVIEFFWYGCPHCYSLEPALAPWMKKLPADVEFKRVPAVLSQNWAAHAQAFYAFESLGVLDRLHRPFFDAIHRDRLRVDDQAAMEQWLQRQGVEPKKFSEAARSFGVTTKVKRAAQLSTAYRLDGVPLLAVQGRYTVSAEQGGSQQGMLSVTDYLIDVSRKELKK